MVMILLILQLAYCRDSKFLEYCYIKTWRLITLLQCCLIFPSNIHVPCADSKKKKFDKTGAQIWCSQHILSDWKMFLRMPSCLHIFMIFVKFLP